MQSILAASHGEAGVAPASSLAAEVAADTGAALRWTTPDEAAAAVAGKAAGADLVIVSPRIPEASGWIYHDSAATSILLHADPAVLVVRRPVDWAIRRVAIPVLRTDLRKRTLQGAAEWIGRLRGTGQAAGDTPVELSVLHVAANPDEMLADRESLREQIDGLRDSAPWLSVRLVRCVRWGAGAHRRVTLWLARQEADLVILDRHLEGDAPGSIHSVWFDAVGAARCPVLLLPRREAKVAGHAPRHASRSTHPSAVTRLATRPARPTART